MTDTARHSIDSHSIDSMARSVFSGLAPSRPTETGCDRRRHLAQNAQPGRFAKSMLSTVPILLMSSMAMTLTLAGAAESASAKPVNKPKTTTADLGATVRTALAAANSAVRSSRATTAGSLNTAAVTVPTTYKVASGDTVSSIAGRFGLSTASVLAVNGLSWKTIIHPGQVLTLRTGGTTASAKPVTAVPTANGRYTIVKGDTISGIAARNGITTQAILTANGLSKTSIIYPGQSLAIPVVSPAPAASAPVVTPPAATPAAPAAAPVASPVVSAPAPVAAGSYVIQSGDNITKIAKKLGVATQAVLSANGLTATSIIYAGRTLVIPGVAPASTSTGTGTITLLTYEMEANAKTIVAVGRELGVSDYGLIVALSAAMQESSLRNISYGHLDSVGLFQQRPSAHWGSVAQLTDARYAARLFFGGPSNPNKGITRGLLEIAGWQSMTVTQAAQRVQISAFPDAYAKWETSARFWLSELG